MELRRLPKCCLLAIEKSLQRFAGAYLDFELKILRMRELSLPTNLQTKQKKTWRLFPSVIVSGVLWANSSKLEFII